MLTKMMNRIKELNDAIPGILLIDLIYLIIGELLILLFFPDKRMGAVGFLAGIIYSVFATFHMSFRIRKIVFGHANTSKTLLIGYFIRFAVMLVLFAVLYLLNMGDLLCAIAGMFSMKVSAYLQPFTNKILSQKRKVRKWEAQ